MATTRTITTAAFIALLATVSAQAQRGPLQLVPPSDEVRMTAQLPPPHKAKVKKAAKKSHPGTARSKTRKAAAAHRSSTPKAAQRQTVRRQTVRHQVVRHPRIPMRHAIAHAVQPAPEATMPPAAMQPAAEATVQTAVPAVPDATVQPESGHVMGGTDTVSLVARLPWWRNDRMQPIRYGSAEAQSQVLAAADAWLAMKPAPEEPAHDTFALASPEEAIVVADAGQANDIDLAATAVPAPPAPTFLQSLIALIGGAAAAAVSARYLFT